MQYTENEICTLLLVSHVGIPAGSDLRPLTPGEWNAFAKRLAENKLEPSVICRDNMGVLKECGYNDAFLARLRSLAGRGAGLASRWRNMRKEE